MILSIRQTLPLLLAVAATNENRIGCDAWMPSPPSSSRNSLTTLQSTPSPNDLPWNGEVVANTNDGKISGCSVTPVGGPPTVEWEITIDGYVLQCNYWKTWLYFLLNENQPVFHLLIVSHNRIIHWNYLINYLDGWLIIIHNIDGDDDDNDKMMDANQCGSRFG